MSVVGPPVSSPLPATEGLNELDRDRSASVADEGGKAAATVESQGSDLEDVAPEEGRRRPQ